MLHRAEIRRDGDAKQAHMTTGRDSPIPEPQRRPTATKQSRTAPRTSPEELRLVSVQLESVCCHPVAHICDTHFKSLAGRRHVLVLTPQVQLRVISVGLEVNIICLDYICKVRCVTCDQTADDFTTFFTDKVDSVCASTISTPPYDVPYRSTPTLDKWTPVTTDKVEKLIGSSSCKTCQLDPVPTWL